ncbi:hypothetical protein ABTY61_40745 [Kitasatospora sp. NPDC096128]|uniref:hypothetical protein n=1 Tax=Kitasatospora sp. NPDC096128 TaxID=3155547 RepID=UPI003322BEC9
MVRGIAATRLRRARRIDLTTVGLDESVEILSRHRDVQFLMDHFRSVVKILRS